MLKTIIFVAFLCFISITLAHAETIFLKDGTKLVGSIIENHEKNILISTDFGQISIPKEKILKIEYVDKKEIQEDDFKSDFLEISVLETKKSAAMTGLLITYGLTIVGDLALGGEFKAESAIPVVGPFIGIITIDEADYANPDEADRDRLLYLLSGIIQSVFLYNYYSIDSEITQLRSHWEVSPMIKNTGLVVSYKF